MVDDGERVAVEVPVVALDDFFAEQGFLPDLVKMDIQGGEWLALRGMTRLLAARKPLAILTEIWPAGLERMGGSARAYLDALAEARFRFHLLDEANDSVADADTAGLLARCRDLLGPAILTVLCQRE